MPNTHSTLRGLFSDIADAIREKDGSSGTIVADTFPDAIRAIPTGGGEAAESKDVNFIDYDGTILYSYTAQEFAALTAMPDNPNHDGLTAQGWNWSLSDAKTHVASYGKLIIGQMYITDDGKTRIYIHLEEGRLSPMLGVCPNGTVTVDWGDGSATTTLTGTSEYKIVWTSHHTYPSSGDYVITLTCSKKMQFHGGSSSEISKLLRYSDAAAGENRDFTYLNSIKKIEIGSGVPGLYGLRKCAGLRTITIPNSVTDVANPCEYCTSLISLTIPNSVWRGMGSKSCSSLTICSMPNCITDFGGFYNCINLNSITIPNSATSILGSAFQNCTSLSSVVIPSNVTTIGGSAFYDCYGLGSIKFTRTTPPTVSSSNAWTSVPTDCIIYVPSSALSAYKSATNYPSSSEYTYVGY